MDNGDPRTLICSYKTNNGDQFVSTHCIVLLPWNDMYRVLTLSDNILTKKRYILLLSGINKGYSTVNSKDCKNMLTKSIKSLKIHFLGITDTVVHERDAFMFCKM